MHDRIIFISHEKFDIKLNTAFLSPYDIGMAGIADYIGDELPIPESVAGVKVSKDGSIIITKSDIENYFYTRFQKLKELSSKTDFATFCSWDLFELQNTIEDKFSDYVVFIDNPAEEYFQTETLDSFMRENYKWSDEYKNQTFYVLACLDYHW